MGIKEIMETIAKNLDNKVISTTSNKDITTYTILINNYFYLRCADKVQSICIYRFDDEWFCINFYIDKLNETNLDQVSKGIKQIAESLFLIVDKNKL